MNSSFDKLKRVLQQCSAPKSMSEHARSVISERLEEALTTGKEFHEQNVNNVVDGLQKIDECVITTLGSSYYLHIDLHTGTCSWLSILKGDQRTWFHILASTFAASKRAWRSSGLHGWCETYFIQMEHVVCFYFKMKGQLSSKSLCSSSPTHFEIYTLTNLICSFTKAAP